MAIEFDTASMMMRFTEIWYYSFVNCLLFDIHIQILDLVNGQPFEPT